MAKNSKYWEQRARQNKLKVIRVEENGINDLKRLLKTNLDDVQKQIKEFNKKYGLDKEQFIQLTLFDLKQYENKLNKAVKKYPKDKTIKKLAIDYPKYKIDRLKALEIDLQLSLSEATRLQEKGLYKTLKDVALVSDAVLTQTFIDGGVNLSHIATRKLEKLLSSDWSGKNWSERLWKDRELVGEKLTEVLETGLTQGTSLQKMSRQLANLTHESFNDAFRLVRTESAFINSSINLEKIKEAKDELGYTMYVYDAFLDNRTSDICGGNEKKGIKGLNGEKFKIDDAVIGENFPPCHPNCRSTVYLDEESIDYTAINYD